VRRGRSPCTKILCQPERHPAYRRTKINGPSSLRQKHGRLNIPGATQRKPLGTINRPVQTGELQDSSVAGAVQFHCDSSGRTFGDENTHMLSEGDLREKSKLSCVSPESECDRKTIAVCLLCKF